MRKDLFHLLGIRDIWRELASESLKWVNLIHFGNQPCACGSVLDDLGLEPFYVSNRLQFVRNSIGQARKKILDCCPLDSDRPVASDHRLSKQSPIRFPIYSFTAPNVLGSKGESVRKTYARREKEAVAVLFRKTILFSEEDSRSDWLSLVKPRGKDVREARSLALVLLFPL